MQLQPEGILSGVTPHSPNRPPFNPQGMNPNQQGMNPNQPPPNQQGGDPRVEAARSIAGNDPDLDPETEHKIEMRRIKTLLDAADRELQMAMAPTEQPVQIAPRIEQEVRGRLQGGTPELLSQLMPGLNQQMQQGRGGPPAGLQGIGGLPQGGQGGPPAGLPQGLGQLLASLGGGRGGPPAGPQGRGLPQGGRGGPPAGGLPQLPAPNLAGPRMAAHGGIVGYQGGGPPIGAGSKGPIPALMEKYGSKMVTDFLEGQKQLRAESQHVAPEYADAYQQKRENFYSRFPRTFIEELRTARSGPVRQGTVTIEDVTEESAPRLITSGLAGSSDPQTPLEEFLAANPNARRYSGTPDDIMALQPQEGESQEEWRRRAEEQSQSPDTEFNRIAGGYTDAETERIKAIHNRQFLRRYEMVMDAPEGESKENMDIYFDMEQEMVSLPEGNKKDILRVQLKFLPRSAAAVEGMRPEDFARAIERERERRGIQRPEGVPSAVEFEQERAGGADSDLAEGGPIKSYQSVGSVQSAVENITGAEVPPRSTAYDEAFADLLGTTGGGTLGRATQSEADLRAAEEAERKRAEGYLGMTQDEIDARQDIIDAESLYQPAQTAYRRAEQAYHEDIASDEETRLREREMLYGILTTPGGVTEMARKSARVRPRFREDRRRATRDVAGSIRDVAGAVRKETVVPAGLEVTLEADKREIRGDVYGKGQELYATISAARNQAMQTASQLVVGIMGTEQAERFQEYNARLNGLNAQLQAAVHAAELGQAKLSTLMQLQSSYDAIVAGYRSDYNNLIANPFFNIQSNAANMVRVRESFNAGIREASAAKQQVIVMIEQLESGSPEAITVGGITTRLQEMYPLLEGESEEDWRERIQELPPLPPPPPPPN